MKVIANAVYVNGVRVADPLGLEETFELVRAKEGLAWIGLYRPDEVELRAVAAQFDLHELAVEDAISAHQRAKMERYGPTLFLVLLPARYLDDVEKVEFGELHVFVGPNF
ncbi:MAG: CorA family divalent cation transporter, partial [Nakamurella sp.]